MASIGGDILEVTFNNPDVGSGVFFPKANEDSTFDTGGFRVDDDVDSIAANGDPIYKKNRKRWFVELPCAMDMNNRMDVDKLEKLANSNNETSWTFTHVNGTVWGAKGMPVGDLQWNGNQSTFTLKASGGQKMTKIVG